MLRLRLAHLLLVVSILSVIAYAKDPLQVIVWPEAGTPVLRFSFGKLKEVSSLGNSHTYVTETLAENLWGRTISNANFSLYVFDKNKVRVGEGVISLNSVAVGQSVRIQTTISVSGTPVSVGLVAKYLPPEMGPARPPRSVSLTVNSIPQGAMLKVDGVEKGTTPKMVQLTVGKHLLEFSREGFKDGSFPVEITPEDASGGSVSYELGSLAHDTVELRDGTVFTGDVESVSATEVIVRMGGKDIPYDRNLIKKIMLVEREVIPQSPAVLPGAQPQR